MPPHRALSCVWLALLFSLALAQSELEIGLRYNLTLTFAPAISTADTCHDLRQPEQSIKLTTTFQPYRGQVPDDFFVQYCRNLEDVLAPDPSPSNNTNSSSNSTPDSEWRNTFSVLHGNNSLQVDPNASNPPKMFIQLSANDGSSSGESADNFSARTAWRSFTFHSGRDCTGSPSFLLPPSCGRDHDCLNAFSAWSLSFEIPGPASEGDPRLEEDGECLILAPSRDAPPGENGAAVVEWRRAGMWWTGGLLGVLGLQAVGFLW